MTEDLRYPIGKFTPQEDYSAQEIASFIQRIEQAPAAFETAVSTLSDSQLDTPYRDGGWTIRQVIHHVTDSHMNAYIRIKWTITEETPTIKAYDEKAWAQTPETTGAPALSLAILKPLHVKWVTLLKQLTPTDLKKQFFHPESKKHIRLETILGNYAWHGEHHLAHITSLKARMNWK